MISKLSKTRYLALGDTGLIVEFGNQIDAMTNNKVISLTQAVEQAQLDGMEEAVPTYCSVLIRYDPVKISYEKLVFQIRDIEKTIKESVEITGARIVIPVTYGGEYGPDLEGVARYHELTPDRVIEVHSSKEYRVYMLGFTAGFPYLGDVSEDIATPRLETPRLKVAKGSVGIAGRQTGIYPCEAPGGWRIIGRTPLSIFDPSNLPPSFLKPGDIVKFEQISEKQFREIREQRREEEKT